MKQVKCIRPKLFTNGCPSGFTAGRIYDIEDGKIIDDQGVPRPAMVTDTIDSIDDVKFYRENEPWGWIGVFEEVKETTISPFSLSV